MKRAIVAAIIVAVAFFAAAALLLTEAAEAHRIPRADAQSRWYYVFKGQCDKGGTCSIRKATLICRASVAHSYDCDYAFRQEKYAFPFAKSYRWCHITGRLKHTTVVYWNRNCTGWS